MPVPCSDLFRPRLTRVSWLILKLHPVQVLRAVPDVLGVCQSSSALSPACN